MLVLIVITSAVDSVRYKLCTLAAPLTMFLFQTPNHVLIYLIRNFYFNETVLLIA